MALVRGIYLGLRAGHDVVLPADVARIAGCSRQVVSAILNREVAEWTPAHSHAAAAEGIRRAQRVRWQGRPTPMPSQFGPEPLHRTRTQEQVTSAGTGSAG